MLIEPMLPETLLKWTERISVGNNEKSGKMRSMAVNIAKMA